MALFVVKARFDEEAEVWYVEDSDVPGLAIEAESLEALIGRVRALIPELIELNGVEIDDELSSEVPVEIIAHASARVRLSFPA